MSSTPVRLFWWAPRKSLRLAEPELRDNPGAWLRLATKRGRTLTNFGDEMSALAVGLATGRPVVWSAPKRADLVAIGSVLELCSWAGFGGQIWGSGLRLGTAQTSIDLCDVASRTLAVRGPHTKAALGLDDAIPVGDPGLLAPRLLDPPRAGRRRRLFVPHFRTWASSSGRASIRHVEAQGFTVVPPTSRPEELIRVIAGASFLLTSSLHGLIVAHSLGVPVQLVTSSPASDQEPDFKFGDYLASLRIQHTPIVWTSVSDTKFLRDVAERRASESDLIMKRAEALSAGLLSAAAPLRA